MQGDRSLRTRETEGPNEPESTGIALMITE